MLKLFKNWLPTSNRFNRIVLSKSGKQETQSYSSLLVHLVGFLASEQISQDANIKVFYRKHQHGGQFFISRQQIGVCRRWNNSRIRTIFRLSMTMRGFSYSWLRNTVNIWRRHRRSSWFFNWSRAIRLNLFVIWLIRLLILDLTLFNWLRGFSWHI